MSCVFCEILSGRAPVSRVYEDDRSLVFLDIRPAREGLIWVIPKAHVDHFCDLADDLALHLVSIAQRLSRVLRKKFEPLRLGRAAGRLGASHAHVVVIPLHAPEDGAAEGHAYMDEGQPELFAGQLPLAEREELDVIAAQLRRELEAD